MRTQCAHIYLQKVKRFWRFCQLSCVQRRWQWKIRWIWKYRCLQYFWLRRRMVSKRWMEKKNWICFEFKFRFRLINEKTNRWIGIKHTRHLPFALDICLFCSMSMSDTKVIGIFTNANRDKRKRKTHTQFVLIIMMMPAHRLQFLIKFINKRVRRLDKNSTSRCVDQFACVASIYVFFFLSSVVSYLLSTLFVCHWNEVVLTSRFLDKI